MFSKYRRQLLFCSLFLLLGFGAGSSWGGLFKINDTEAKLTSSATSMYPGLKSGKTDKLISVPTFLTRYSTKDLKLQIDEEVAKPLKEQNPLLVELFLYEWAGRDPEAALIYALENNYDRALYKCLEVYGSDNADLALNWVAKHASDTELNEYYTQAVYRGLAKESPEDAIARLGSIEEAFQRNQILNPIIEEWAKYDVLAVFDWIETQKPSQALVEIYSKAMSQYIMQSPKIAIALVSEMENSRDKKNFANQVAFELSKTDPQATLDWVETLDQDIRHSALLGLMQNWGGRSDSSVALEYVKSLSFDTGGREVFSTLTRQLTKSSPDYLEHEIPFFTEEQQMIASAQLAHVYSSQPVEKAISWVNSLEIDSVRDVAVKTVLKTLRQTNVDQAFELALTISEANQKRNEIQEILLNWIPVNPDAAMEALAISPLPQDRKEAIMISLESQPPRQKSILLPAK